MEWGLMRSNTAVRLEYRHEWSARVSRGACGLHSVSRACRGDSGVANTSNARGIMRVIVVSIPRDHGSHIILSSDFRNDM